MEGLYDATTLCVLLTLPVYDACIWLCCIGGLALSRTVLRRATVHTARLAQSAERKALNLVVVGSSPTVGFLSTQCIAGPTSRLPAHADFWQNA